MPVPRIPYSDVCQSLIRLLKAGLTDGAHRFLPADALWNFAMAINVYMTLFRKYNAQQLKSLEWRYHLMCYGGPFFIAFIYLFIHTEAKGPIYGPATLWCWIDINWVALRIATCYAPAWCCILFSFCIYAISGREIFMKRQQLRAFNNAPAGNVPVEDPFTDFKTTEIRITSELATLQLPDPITDPLPAVDGVGREGINPSPTGHHYDPYTVTIDSVLTDPKFAPTVPSDPREKAMSPLPVPKVDLPQAAKPSVQQKKNRAALEANVAAWGYAKVAMLFFISLLITWVSRLLPVDRVLEW